MKKLNIVIILIGPLILLSSCTPIGASHHVGNFKKAHGNEEKINKAQLLHEMGEFEAAISQLKTIIDITPYSFIHDKAYELLITWLLEIRKETEAKRYASYFMAHYKDSPSINIIISLFNKKSADPKNDILKTAEPILPSYDQIPDEPENDSENFILELEQLSLLEH